jgi:hypothetical protein
MLLGKPLEATLPVALDPAVDGVGMDPEHSRGLGLGHAVQHRSDGPVAQRCLCCGRHDRVSSSVMPGAYDTITPFAYRSDNWCHSMLLDPDATISIDLHKRLFLLVTGRGE